jgi:catechol 2,3-dioxygenase
VVNKAAATDRSYGIAPPGFRLPDAAHVGAVHLQVSDLQRSVTYYEQVIGLRTVSSTSNTAELGPHGDARPLVRLQTRDGVVPARRGSFGLYHFAILLPDRAALGRFVTHVSALGVRVGTADHLVSEALYLWDPDGLGIEVYADRPRSTWRHQERELAMTTDPLDVNSLMSAAAGVVWTGAPPGTVMGHVHLHVGAIEAAENFYHRALGLDKTVWSYPGALFLAAGGYHHHLGTNVWAPGPSPLADHAQLLAWELVMPSPGDVSAARESLSSAGHAGEEAADGFIVTDPWGTRLHVRIDPTQSA